MTGDKDTIGWYDENGNSAARTLIRTPISGARLSSSFGHRKHPVSGFNAMHKGVDFAAPRGTPIIAAGSGVIREAGWKGSFGRYIRIRHNATYDTAYAHMSRIAPNIHPGITGQTRRNHRICRINRQINRRASSL
jgi:murein DD-endopeptidase MepM/ murein hydrolase activator NlpD